MSGDSSIERLGDRIAELNAHLSAATARLLKLLGEFDATEGHVAFGMASSAEWFAWRCDVAPGTAREHVRVARALRDFPMVEGAFATGELSFSKVRALTRAGDGVDELTLLDWARRSTAAQLDELVASLRRATVLEHPDQRHRLRALRWHYDDEGCFMIRVRLTPEDGEIVLAAIKAAMEQLAREAGRADAPAVPGTAIGGTHAPAGAPAGTVGHAPAGTPAGTIGHAPAGTPAGTVGHAPAGTPAGTIGDAPAGTRAALAGPPRAIPSVDSSSPGVLAWPKIPIEVSSPLEQAGADALVLLAESYLANGPAVMAGDQRAVLLVHTDDRTLSGAAPKVDCGSDEDQVRGRAELGNHASLHPETVRRIACDAGIVRVQPGTMSVGRQTRVVPAAMRRALTFRDRTCRFPGCRSRRVDAHHIRHWAQGGDTSLDNLVLLCRRHHRAVHEGGFRLTLDQAGGVAVWRPNGEVVPEGALATQR